MHQSSKKMRRLKMMISVLGRLDPQVEFAVAFISAFPTFGARLNKSLQSRSAWLTVAGVTASVCSGSDAQISDDSVRPIR